MYFFKLLFSSIGSAFGGIFTSIGNATRGFWEPVWRLMSTTFKFKEDEVKRPLIVLISILVIGGSLISIFLSQRPRTVKLNLKPFEHLGIAMGEKVSQMAGSGGTVVLWRMRSQAKIAVIDVPIKHFKQIMDKKGIRMVAEEEEVMNQPPVMAPDMMMGGMAGDKFLGLINKYPNANVLVLFGATPHLTDDQLTQLPQRRPKVFVVAMYDLPRKTLFESGIVQEAIVPRFTQPQGGSTNEPVNAEDWFNRYYTIVTPESAESLPW